MSLLLAMGWLVALAAEPVTVIVSATRGPDADEVDAALRRGGLRATQQVDGSVLARTIRFAAVNRRTADEDCGGTVDLGAWRGEIEAARKRFSMLQFEPALADLVGLELEAACLTAPPAASDLFRLELAVAEAHRFLAEASDEDGREFHQGEMDGALARAAVFGSGLVAPADSTPELLAALDVARSRIARAPAPRVLLAGPGAKTGARVNGRPAPTGPFDGVPGINLVQSSVGGTVVAAASVDLEPGKPMLVWLAPGESTPPADVLVRDVDAIGEAAPDADTAARLAAAAWLLAEDREGVVFAGRVDREVVLWRAEGGDLRRIGAAKAAVVPTKVELPPWVWCFGVSAGGGYATIHDGGLDDLGGARMLTGVYGRIGIAERWNVAITAQPDLLWRPLTPVEGDGTLFHLTIPARAGVRWGPRGDEWSPEVGLDVGVQYFGNIDGADRASPIGVLAGGVGRGLGRQTGVRAEAFVGGGLGYVTGGLAVGLEARR